MIKDLDLLLRSAVTEVFDTMLNLKPEPEPPQSPGLEVLDLCDELALKHRMIGSEMVSRECKQYEEAKDWRFVNSFEEPLASLNGEELVHA